MSFASYRDGESPDCEPMDPAVADCPWTPLGHVTFASYVESPRIVSIRTSMGRNIRCRERRLQLYKLVGWQTPDRPFSWGSWYSFFEIVVGQDHQGNVGYIFNESGFSVESNSQGSQSISSTGNSFLWKRTSSKLSMTAVYQWLKRDHDAAPWNLRTALEHGCGKHTTCVVVTVSRANLLYDPNITT